MITNQTLFIGFCIITLSCSQVSSNKNYENQLSKDSLNASNIKKEGRVGEETDSATFAEIEEFNNSDHGSPGIEDTWRDSPSEEEHLFFKSLKSISSNPNLFAIDSIPFISASQGIYAQVTWLKEPSDLLGIDEFILLLNPNSSFGSDNLKLNEWHFEDECQLEEFPDGIYLNGENDKSNYLSYPIFEDQQKQFNLFKKKLSKFNIDLIQTYYLTWHTESDGKLSVKIHAVKVDSTLKILAVSNFICGG